MNRMLMALALAAAARAGVIQGVVLEQVSGRPLARTVVQLRPVPGTAGEAAAARAGRSGQFAFSPVAPGLYLLTAVRDGYFPAAYGQRQPAGRGTAIQVTAESSFFADLRLRHKGAVTGRVLDENGVGTAGVRVVAYRARLPLRAAGSGVSNDRGVYRIFGLDPGKYWVRSATHVLDDGSGWLPTFGPQSRESRDARAHPVTVDGETAFADVSPEPGALFRLRGTVGCGTDAPVTVTLSSETGRRTTQAGCGRTYEFQGLSPGAYEVFAAFTDGSGAGFTELSLDRDSESGSVQLAPLGGVMVLVQMAGTRPGARAPLDLPVRVTGRRQDLAEVEGTREFPPQRHTPAAPGNQEFRAQAPGGYYVESVAAPYAYRRRSRPDRPGARASEWYDVFVDGRQTQVWVTLSDRPGRIQGRVMAEGKGVPGAPVFLWPVEESARRSLGGAPQALTDVNGSFRFGGLPPGDYRIAATFDLHELDEESAEECRVRTVRVEAAKDAVLELPLWMAP